VEGENVGDLDAGEENRLYQSDPEESQTWEAVAQVEGAVVVWKTWRIVSWKAMPGLLVGVRTHTLV
jgi:hypothetical protein